ncbi:MAG: GAF domain-containing protein [Rhodospirillales bacterium]|nr:GAF domain-containing protein [Rhodospirillales bacterium]
MHDAKGPNPWTGERPLDKGALYRELATEIDALLQGESDPVANAANAAAAIYHGLDRLNWAGFYLLRDGELVLGPFQGRPACVRIPMGRGVCGTAAASRRSVLVPDVHEFPGHIACDAASRSELVVPLIADGRLLGVLDLDSPEPARFDATDQAGCEAIAAVLVRHLGPAMLSCDPSHAAE